MGSGNSGVDRGLEERRDGVGAKSGAKCGRQATAQIGYQRGGRDRSRPQGCKGGAVSWEKFGPAKLAGLQNTKGVGEGETEAVAENAKSGSSVIEKLGHGMIRVENEAWRSRRRGADASKYQGCGESRRVDRVSN
jgi:hypothetical protein